MSAVAERIELLEELVELSYCTVSKASVNGTEITELRNLSITADIGNSATLLTFRTNSTFYVSQAYSRAVTFFVCFMP